VFLGSDRLSIKRHRINNSGYRGGAGSRTSHSIRGIFNVADYLWPMPSDRCNRSKHGLRADGDPLCYRFRFDVVGYNRSEQERER